MLTRSAIAIRKKKITAILKSYQLAVKKGLPIELGLILKGKPSIGLRLLFLEHTQISYLHDLLIKDKLNRSSFKSNQM